MTEAAPVALVGGMNDDQQSPSRGKTLGRLSKSKMEDTEEIRRMYRPRQVRLLLVGESPPASGKFFYCGGPMTRYTARAFELAYRVCLRNSTEFLAFFKEQGAYLDDLSPIAVNTMSAAKRLAQLKACVPDISRRIEALNPEVVVTILRRIEPYVRAAIALTGKTVTFRSLPFPGQGHQTKYVAGLAEIIKRSLLAKL